MDEDGGGLFHYLMHERKDLHDLMIVMGWALLTVLVIKFLPGVIWLRTLFSIPFLLFLPGYALTCMFWPNSYSDSSESGADDSISLIERLGFSVGISLAILIGIGLALNFTSWGLALTPILTSIFLLMLVFTLIAFIRRIGLPKEERFVIGHYFEYTPLKDWSPIDRIVVIVLVIFIAAAFIWLVSIIYSAPEGEYSQFYILGPNGMASDYPKNLSVGEDGVVRIGIICNEKDTVKYTIVTGTENATTVGYIGDMSQTHSLNGHNKYIFNITLKNDEKFEEEFSFEFTTPGRYKLQWELLMNNKPTEYKNHLWIEVG